jgi:hypothetical protein
VPQLNKGLYSGHGAGLKLWTFDFNAPTPKSAWTLISEVDESSSHKFAYPSFCMMTNAELYWWNNLVAIGGHAVHLTTGVRRTPTAPPDPLNNNVGSNSSYCYLRRASTALRSRVFYTHFSSAVTPGLNQYHCRYYDPQTNTHSAMNAGNVFPSWWPMLTGPGGGFAGTQYRTIALASGSWGDRVVGYPGTGHADGVSEGNPNNPGNEQYKIFCWNPDANTMMEYTSSATPRPTGGVNSTPAQRWQFVPQVKAFVALLRHMDNVWVFRPPATWGIT